MLLECFEGDPGAEAVSRRLSDRVKDERDITVQALVTLLDQIKSLKPDLESAGVEEREHTGPGKLINSRKQAKSPPVPFTPQRRRILDSDWSEGAESVAIRDISAAAFGC